MEKETFYYECPDAKFEEMELQSMICASLDDGGDDDI